MLYIVIAFLFLAILLYFLLGGADFGAGIIELFTSNNNKTRVRRTMYRAIGPIWEANHMWLIIAIVILFVGFPVIYSQMCTYLHIPLLVMLLGIIARGTAFSFRNYDAIQDDKMQDLYNYIFVYSSFVTPLFLGIIAGSVISGQIDPGAASFMAAYVFGWFNWFSVAVGFFTVALCGYLAAVYLIGEANDEDGIRRFIKKARLMNILTVVFGALVFVAAAIEDVPLPKWVFGNAVSLSAVIAAVLSLVLLWFTIYKGRKRLIRILAGFQMSMILLSVGYTRFPNFIIFKGGGTLSLLTAYANPRTIEDLGLALLIGSLVILPSLFYLYYSFQKRDS